MKLTTGRYTLILCVQTLLFVADFAINTLSVFSRQHNAVMLILFIVQDACLILALSALLLTLFSTYVFQTGLMDLLYERFRTTLVVCMVYFALTTVLHVWSLVTRWNNSFSTHWSYSFIVFLIIQRLASTAYYYFYKRAAFRISDPRFNQDMEIEHSKILNGQIIAASQ